MDPKINPKDASLPLADQPPISREVKNAHAAGDGAMERGDVKADPPLADEKALEPKDQDGIPY